MLKQGLYEQLINRMIGGEIKKAEEENMYVDVAPVDTGEASKVLSQYLTEIIEKGLDNVRDNGGSLADQIALVNRLVDAVKTETREDSFGDMSVDRQAEQLLAFFDKKDSILAVNEKAQIVRPVTSLAHSSLFTGAVREPQLGSELKKEIASCDRIDMLVSFIKWSGLRQILEDLKVFVQRGGILRIITTSYMGATDLKAIEELAKLPNTSIKVSYDTKRTRLHAKTYVFYRNTGFTTAYIGSSNLSNAAMTSGLEWNLKITQKDQPETLQKIDLNEVAEIIFLLGKDTNVTDLSHLPQEKVRLALPCVCRKTLVFEKKIADFVQAGYQKWEIANYWGLEALRPYCVDVRFDSPIYVMNSQATVMAKDLGATSVTLSLEDTMDNLKLVAKKSCLPVVFPVYTDVPLFTSAACIRSNPCSVCRAEEKWMTLEKNGKKYQVLSRDCQTMLFFEAPLSHTREAKDIAADVYRVDFVYKKYSAEAAAALWKKCRNFDDIDGAESGNINRRKAMF